MALSVTGVDSNGRITTGTATSVSAGRLVPPQSAGIGDLIYKSGTTYKVIACGTAGSNSTITIGGTSYTLWGCIYGFVAGMAMVVSINSGEKASLTWGTYPSNAPYWGAGTVLMRNNKKTDYYAQMNTAQQMSSDSYRGTAGSNVHPTAAYSGGVMTESTFNSSTDAKKIYGTWKEYLRQTLRVNGAPGTPFGATADGVKVHEFGRWMTKNYLTNSSNNPAGAWCYNWSEGSGTWWLPSMFELGELMIDEHWDKVNANSSVLSVSRGVDRWSSVLFSSSYAWRYYGYGVSYSYGLSDSYSYLVARPVTLLSLV